MSLLTPPLRPALFPPPCYPAAKLIRLSRPPSPPPTSHSPRHASTNTSSSPPKQRTWLRITLVTALAAAIGAYMRYQQDSSTATLNPSTFTEYELVFKTPVSSTSSIFTLRPVKSGHSSAVHKEAWQRGLWSVQFKQPQLQIGRDYTPLPPTFSQSEKSDNGEMTGDSALRFLIRRDPHGEVSGYLHNLPTGARVDVRGPRLEYALPADVEEILFIAGGTGIAPGLQAAYTLFRKKRRPESSARMHILWANRRREDCLGGVGDSSSARPAPGSSNSWWKRIFSSSSSSSNPVAAEDAVPRERDNTENSARKSITVRHLEELKAKHPGLLTVDYFVDEEGSSIGKESILDFTKSGKVAEGASRTETSARRGKRVILISGPDGFISYLAGPKVWSGGQELQGPLQGIIRQLDLKDWSVWKL
ncbi:hypothetical protein PAAG_03614 [Paracoccidioides lutzii Pb01]|uniref:FAD-binding FR-type domain-containing protein n=1 Tax=Paracoccidioides lutzii (strain ATCC MYA-826 / Pb01) TaxID=502779 RepID=C1GXP0_PARBA|nr:hypothetical protein PAAG_03614 [Paracoccidioides lutzii Pb01]EEH41328.2 hypothetical protein PAAG_03614 [Paracoccidioides lutzii Pb01]